MKGIGGRNRWNLSKSRVFPLPAWNRGAFRAPGLPDGAEGRLAQRVSLLLLSSSTLEMVSSSTARIFPIGAGRP